MENRKKMERSERAKQFSSFDALKGLKEALVLKEYEHDKLVQGELDEEQIKANLEAINNLENGDNVFVKYFFDGYFYESRGKVKLELKNECLFVDGKKILIDWIYEIKKF